MPVNPVVFVDVSAISRCRPAMIGLLAPVVILLVALAPGAPVSASEGDYLGADLRARVEKLKADAARTPTDEFNLAERARLLWQWANAWALAGRTLPVNLTQAVAAVAAYPEARPQLPQVIDGFLFELSTLDASPDVLGTLVADTGPFEARSFVTIRQTYTVGSRDIEPGGGFVVARHFMPNYGLWQTEDPAADNYISIESDNPSVRFAIDSVPMGGMHGGFRGTRPTLFFRVTAGRLTRGDSVTITYGDTRQGSRGFLMADFESDRMPLPLYLAFAAGEPFFTLPIQPIVITGTRFAGLHGFAPSIVGVDEPVELAVRAQDAYYNKAIDGHPDVLVKDGSQVLARLPAGPRAIETVELVFSEPGVQRLSLETADGTITGTVNPILVERSPATRIYWGDTHGHSGFAEGIGTPDQFMTWARDDARLDFVTHSEHDIWLDDAEWEVLRDNVRRYSREGEFIAYLGYEWTVRNLQGGHHNVLFRTPTGRDRLGAQFYPTLSSLYHGLRNHAQTNDVIVIPHAHQSGDYRQSDPQLEPLVEIMSQHGNFEWFGRMYLQHGHQVGFIAASDNHLSQPGYSAPKNTSLAQMGGLAAVRAVEKSTDALFDAMRALATYATTGDRIILSFDVNGTPMGGRAPFAEARTLSGRVIGTAPIESITVIRNGEPLWQADYLTDTGSAQPGSESLLLSFLSDSQPLHPGDNPRGWRHWRGQITVEGARLAAFEGQDFHNVVAQAVERDTDDPNLLHFRTLTRGDSSSISLELEDVSRSAALHLVLEETRETGGAPPLYRPPQSIPESRTTIRLRDLVDGKLERPMPAAGYDDQVILRRRLDEGHRELRFEITDSSARQGDYYFVRVRQANDAVAWSSPVWVGGYPPR